MSFLEKIWQQLEEKKNQLPKEMQFKEVYKGYRTIPIQSLPRKQPNFSNKNANGKDLWKATQNTQIFTYMQNSKFTNEAENGFFYSFFKAYMQHGDIKIKPDEVWMMIMLWFTKYVDDNAEQLRFAFVMHQGKKQLVVTTDKNLHDWVPFMNGVINQIKKNTVQKVVEELECNFTSTAFFDRIFSTALIMNTCKKYFDYTRAGGGCGVVNVHMAGVLEDWEKLERKLANLEHFDVNGQLKKYIRGLKPVLNQFTQTFKGNAHLQFWNNLYFQRKVPSAHEYMPSKFINGWLIKFFTTSDQITSVEQLESFSVDIKYVDIDTKQIIYFNLNGGCKGYSCIDDYVYTPHYSFAIVKDLKKMKNRIKEVRIDKAVNKHKERMMKKKVENTPIANKKVVNIEFKAYNPEIRQVNYDIFSLMKKQEGMKSVKMTPKQLIRHVIIPPKIITMSSNKKKQENEDKQKGKLTLKK